MGYVALGCVCAVLAAASLHAQIPQRSSLIQTGAAKSCTEIARFVLASKLDRANQFGDFHCAAAHSVPADAELELTKSTWNRALQRWEFALRCARPKDCVPFLVWASAEEDLSALGPGVRAPRLEAAQVAPSPQLVRPGQTATLTWDAEGIRIVVPVTCLDAGTLGQKVRVRIKNAAGVLQAEVVGAGAVRLGF